MDIQTKTVGEVTVVTLAGELTAGTAPAANEAIVPLIAPGGRLLLDLAGVAFMSSAGLRFLLVVFRTAGAKGGRVVLAGLRDDVQSTMSLTGFLDFFQHEPTVEAALARLA